MKYYVFFFFTFKVSFASLCIKPVYHLAVSHYGIFSIKDFT